MEKLPEPEKNQLLERLREIQTKPVASTQTPFVVQTWPLGIRSDKLPSHLLEELDEEDHRRKLREGR